MPRSEKFTGEKLAALEKDKEVLQFLEALENASANFSTEERKGLEKIAEALLSKNLDSISNISGAAYSAITIYKKNDEYLLHAGANIDPEHKNLFKSIEYRNCAEKQASMSARNSDQLNNDYLRYLFLYRRPDKEYPPEKLLPCIDCTHKYVLDLVKNQGNLVIVLPDSKERNFFIEKHTASNEIHQLNQKLFYKVFNSEDLNFLRIEQSLGSRVLEE